MRKKAESVIDEYTVVFTLKDFPNYHLICSLQVSRLHIGAEIFLEFYLKLHTQNINYSSIQIFLSKQGGKTVEHSL